MILLSHRPLGTSDADHQLFVDRTSELARVRRALELELNVYVHGPRGIGRTTFLRQLQRDWPDARFVNLAPFDSQSERLDALVAAVTGESVVWHRGEPPAMAVGRALSAFRGEVARSVEDPLQDLRDATQGRSGQSRYVLLVDDLPRRDCHQLFGRLRDEMWEIPICWIVGGIEPYLDPPADSFFEVQLELSAFNREALRQLSIRRAATGTEEERRALLRAVRALPPSISPCTPRRALSVLRDIYLANSVTEASRQIAEVQASRAQLSPSAKRVLDGLEAHGPTHAGDEALLASLDVTRSRVVQVLGELESQGLVSSQRVGRRKIYAASRELPVVGSEESP